MTLSGDRLRRHRYRSVPRSNGMCECGQGRSENVHDLMVWHKSGATGNWYSGPVGGVAYRIRTRWGSTLWWPEFTTLVEENWMRVGTEAGVLLAQAKELCEEHREAAETTAKGVTT